MECSGDNVILLFLGQLNEVYSITGNTDSQLRIVLGVLLSVQKSILSEHVYVEVMTALCGIAIEKSNQVIYLLCINICHNNILLLKLPNYFGLCITSCGRYRRK